MGDFTSPKPTQATRGQQPRPLLPHPLPDPWQTLADCMAGWIGARSGCAPGDPQCVSEEQESEGRVS